MTMDVHVAPDSWLSNSFSNNFVWVFTNASFRISDMSVSFASLPENTHLCFGFSLILDRFDLGWLSSKSNKPFLSLILIEFMTLILFLDFLNGDFRLNGSTSLGLPLLET